MNSTSSERLKIKAGFSLLAIFFGALFASGCGNHGPVGFYSYELFGIGNDRFGTPNLELSSTSQLTFTVQTGGVGNSQVNPFGGLFVNIFNGGGSATYGPVVCTFSANNTPYWNFVLSDGQSLAIADDGVDQEIPNNGTILTLERGYVLNNVPIINDVSSSLQFWTNQPYVDGTTYTPVIIYMSMVDGLGETFLGQFTVYINT